MSSSHLQTTDVLIVGAGLAGLSAALQLAAQGRRVTILVKRDLSAGASYLAQGGIAAAMGPDDSFEQHAQDTQDAGAGLCDAAIVRQVVQAAPGCIEWLRAEGVQFTLQPDGQRLHLTREGGHTRHRVVHARDATGAAIQDALLARARAEPLIEWRTQHCLVDLICTGVGAARRCHGLYALDLKSDRVVTFSASQILLATGGASHAYLYSTNPLSASGDGIATAWRAGCRVMNMEFTQFHPTCLYHPLLPNFLISEAVRGEGGLLRLPGTGERFMPAHDPRAELAPRDIVARAIDYEMKRHGLDFVHLDITHKGRDFIEAHFPMISQRCRALGLDIATQPIPVVPAAHYTCGGHLTDASARSDIAGLYAAGEAACTGLHGANRLASNSLLECVVFGQASARAIAAEGALPPQNLPAWDESQVSDADEQVVIAHNWDELRRCLWNYVGIVRTDKRLERAARRIDLLRAEIADFYARFRISSDLLELRNLVEVAGLIVRSAQARHESRGLHFSRDYPQMLPQALPTILAPSTPVLG